MTSCRPNRWARKSGHVSLVTRTESQGSTYEAWQLTWMAPVAKGWRAPTLILDATAREDYRFALRAALPGLRDDLGGEIRAATPHLEIKAVIGRDFSLKAIKATPKRAREIAAVARRELLALGGGCALVVANKGLADAIREAGPPHGIEVAHFNAVRGLDTWRQARLQITVGRTLPPPEVVELIAGAITGSAIEPLVGVVSDGRQEARGRRQGRRQPARALAPGQAGRGRALADLRGRDPAERAIEGCRPHGSHAGDMDACWLSDPGRAQAGCGGGL